MKKVASFLTLILTSLFFITGCGSLLYSAILYGNANEWIKESFAGENLTRKTSYYNEARQEYFWSNDEIYPKKEHLLLKIKKHMAKFLLQWNLKKKIH